MRRQEGRVTDTRFPNDTIRLLHERVEGIARVCRRVGGTELEGKCLDKIRQNGYTSPVQHIYGLIYCADKGVEDDLRYLDLLERAAESVGRGVPWKVGIRPSIDSTYVRSRATTSTRAPS